MTSNRTLSGTSLLQGALATAALCFGGCPTPPDAGRELNELMAAAYTSVSPESDEAALTAAVEDLHVWLVENIASAVDGYTVDNLDAEIERVATATRRSGS